MSARISRIGLSHYLAPIALLLLPACDNGEPGEDLGDPGTPAIQHVTNEDGPQYEGLLFEVREDLVLGTDDGEPKWQVFGSHVDLVVGDEGQMYMADRPSGNIFIVSTSGDLLGTFGGRGSGPGEYQMLGGLWWVEDGPEVWFSDANLRRVSRFTPDGKLIDTKRFSGVEESFVGLLQIAGRRFLGRKPQHEGEQVLTQYAFLDDDLQWDREFITLLSQRMWRSPDGNWIAYWPRFEGRPRIATFSDGRIVISDPRNSWITIYSPEGEAEIRFVRDWVAPPITAEERREFYRSVGNLTEQQVAASARLPEAGPPFQQMVTDDESRIWVQRTRTAESEQMGGGFEYDVFDTEGRWLGTQPLDFTPLIIKGGYLYDTRQGNEVIGPRVYRFELTWLH